MTSQRLLIDRALRDHGGHLTAEQVHDLVEPVLPGVTQQTVYSTLAPVSYTLLTLPTTPYV